MLTEISVSSPARKNINYYLENVKKKKKKNQTRGEMKRYETRYCHFTGTVVLDVGTDVLCCYC